MLLTFPCKKKHRRGGFHNGANHLCCSSLPTLVSFYLGQIFLKPWSTHSASATPGIGLNDLVTCFSPHSFGSALLLCTSHSVGLARLFQVNQLLGAPWLAAGPRRRLHLPAHYQECLSLRESSAFIEDRPETICPMIHSFLFSEPFLQVKTL